MRDRLRGYLLRWDRLGIGLILALPSTVLMVLGFFWLIEHGWLLIFLAVSIGLGGVASLVRAILRWRGHRLPVTGGPEIAGGVSPNPEWSEREAAAYRAAQDLIRERTRTALPWEEVQEVAVEVVRTVAAKTGPREKDPMEFTLPEALLLVERVAARLRGDLRRLVPFSDSLSLRTGLWVWRNRGAVQGAAQAGHVLWRVFRFVKNPPVAVVQEVDRAVAGGHSAYLSSEAFAIGQAILLEEVAKAAVDLYSGRLKFSDAELLDLQVADSARDLARLAGPDAPVRIAVAGQVSSGKSTLINALTGTDRAETDVGPTTGRDAAYPIAIDGTDCLLIDLPGLDGTPELAPQVRAEMAAADLVLWVTRANRPARAIDARVLATFVRDMAEHPERRPPQVIPVVTAVDTLDPGWPYPEHRLPPGTVMRIAALVEAVAAELASANPVPVSSVTPEWNLETLRGAIAGHLPEALMVQRNRARIAAGGKPRIGRETRRGIRGIGAGLGALGGRWWDRLRGD